MQNSNLGMTKEQYFDMCEQLNTEPVDQDIPVELDDFAVEVQLALNIYKILRDEWEFVAGNYLGKNINGIFEVFEAYGIEAVDKRFYLELIHLVDSVRIEQIRLQKKHEEKPAKAT